MLVGTRNAVGLARLHTADVLSRWGVHPDSIETVKLLVSELTTNAVRCLNMGQEESPPYSEHNTTQTFELALEITNGAIRASVWDRDSRPPILKQVGVDATGGRGLFIVAAMSRRWGSYPVCGLPGKVVWAEVPLVLVTHGRADISSDSPRLLQPARAVRPTRDAQVRPDL
ncbi:ATP-binding protein [Peterkaempfera bronchialis]|nr:ATP-binding protein [Peterkaempfera bronchialis]